MASLLDLEQDRCYLLENIFTYLEATDDINEDDADIKEDDVETLGKTLDLLNQLEQQIANKVDSITAIISTKEAEIKYIDDRIKHFQALKKSKEKSLNNFKNHIKSMIDRRLEKKIEGNVSSLAIVNNGGNQPIWVNEEKDPSEYPDEFVKEKKVYSLNKDALRQALQVDKEIKDDDGKILAYLLPRGKRLVIK
jgi:hypothetical protein